RKLAGISRIKLGLPWAIPSVFWRLVRKRSHHIFVTRVKEEMGGSPEIGIDGYSHPQVRDPPHRYVRGEQWLRIPNLPRLLTDSVPLADRLWRKRTGLQQTTFLLALLGRPSSSRNWGKRIS